jgi:hypothetical protein
MTSGNPDTEELSTRERIKLSLSKAAPKTVQYASFALFLMYGLASVPFFSSSRLVKLLNSAESRDLLIGTAFGLGWASFTILLSAERKTARKLQVGRVIKSADLGREMQRFLDEPEIKLDLFAYTAETFVDHLSEFLDAAQKATPVPRQINIRILLKNWKRSTSLLPGCSPSASEEIQEQRANYRREQKHHHEYMFHHLRTIVDRVPNNLKVTIDIKYYHLDPFHKGILINQRVGFWNLYPIRRDSAFHPDIWDWQGRKLEYAEFSRDGSRAEALALRSVRAWFTEIWEGCCSDSEL